MSGEDFTRTVNWSPHTTTMDSAADSSTWLTSSESNQNALSPNAPGRLGTTTPTPGQTNFNDAENSLIGNRRSTATGNEDFVSVDLPTDEDPQGDDFTVGEDVMGSRLSVNHFAENNASRPEISAVHRPTEKNGGTDSRDLEEHDVRDLFTDNRHFGPPLSSSPPPMYPLLEFSFLNSSDRSLEGRGNSSVRSRWPMWAGVHDQSMETELMQREQEKPPLDSPVVSSCPLQVDLKDGSALSEKQAEAGNSASAGDQREEGEDGVAAEESEKGEKGMSPLRQLLSLWYVAVIVLTPLILLPLPLVINTPQAKCAYVIFVMAVFWVTEAIPIPVTSLMPVFLLPMMGLLPARDTSAAYINDTSILFMGGLTVAIAIERWNLHRRIALGVMLVVGSEPRWLMMGMMLVTWFLSMWISNTATTAMMLPIVSAVLQQISAADKPAEQNSAENVPGVTDSETKSTTTEISDPKKDKKGKANKKTESPEDLSSKKLEKALSLAIAYSANVGGIASLTGTGPNLVLLGQSQIIFQKVGLNTPISFATWLVYGLPLSFMLVIVVWAWLQIIFLRCRGGCDCILKRGSRSPSERNSKVQAVIREELRKLGPVSYAEGTIMVFFAILVVLWITRDLGGTGGWANIFRENFVSDSTPAILTAVVLFILPSSLPDILFRSRRQAKGPRKPLTALMNWKVLHEKMPWSLYLLLGGGFAIAEATQASGLSLWLGEKLAVFGALNPWVMLLIICYIITFVTEVTSNTAIATIMMPILAQLSLTLNVNPLFFMFPVAITTSFAFMLPVATPPNAIVFAFGAVRVIDMAMCGFVLNIISVPFLLLATVTWGNAFFHFDVVPPAFLQNVTALANITSTA